MALVVFVIAAILLGRWQWDRTQTILAAERAAISAAIPLAEVFAEPGAAQAAAVPDEGIGRPVTLTGEYVPDQQVVVTNREHDGQPDQERQGTDE